MGRIAAAHGVRGAVKVKPESADPAALLAYGEWWLRQRGGEAWTPRRVRSVREQGTMLVAELAGVESREAAATLHGFDVGVPRDWLPAAGKDEHYQADLVGMRVVNRDGVTLGVLADFVESGAHPIARVVDDAGVERLIPWVEAYIDAVDVEARQIDVDWPAAE
jgi:16S rRNA processing protein RimM